VFIAQLTYRTDQLNLAYQTGLLALSNATGGSATISRSIAEIPTAIDELLDRILDHYSVQVAVPASEHNKVDVRLKTSEGNPLTHRSSYILRH
jgi:hypothetical protein